MLTSCKLISVTARGSSFCPQRRLYAWPCGVLMVMMLASAGCRKAPGPPYDAEDALHTFQLEAGFRLELLVSEPDIVDPVAMEIDEYGRWYVVENPGYPLDF